MSLSQTILTAASEFRTMHGLDTDGASGRDLMEINLHDALHYYTACNPSREDECIVESIEYLLLGTRTLADLSKYTYAVAITYYSIPVCVRTDLAFAYQELYNY